MKTLKKPDYIEGIKQYNAQYPITPSGLIRSYNPRCTNIRHDIVIAPANNDQVLTTEQPRTSRLLQFTLTHFGNDRPEVVLLAIWTLFAALVASAFLVAQVVEHYLFTI